MDKDIQNIFKEKNREILITNLKYDLDKNIGSLMETLTNIFNLTFDEAIKKIETIFNDANILDEIKEITEIVNNMKLDSYRDLDDLINEKKSVVLCNIKSLNFTEKNMQEYYDMIFNTTKNIKDKLKHSLSTIIANGNNELEKIVKCSDKSLVISRLDDYLNNRFYEKLETKVHMEIMLRDNNLINKAKEGYVKYQDLCSKTLV